MNITFIVQKNTRLVLKNHEMPLCNWSLINAFKKQKNNNETTTQIISIPQRLRIYVLKKNFLQLVNPTNNAPN